MTSDADGHPPPWADLESYLRAAHDLRGLLTPDGIRGALIEAAWLSAHLAMYPFGLARERQHRWTGTGCRI